jgi:hypothetical protein
MRQAATVAAILLGAIAVPGIASGRPDTQQRFYMVLYGAQSVPIRIPQTHTWASFIRTSVDAMGERPVELLTISWMPATLKIRYLSLKRESGIDLSLDETLNWVSSYNGRVSFWGPYEITAERYYRYVARKEELDSGEVTYRAIGSLTRDPTVSNCGQSFARASRRLTQEYDEPTPVPGENGTSRLAMRYINLGLFIHPEITHDWLLPFVGVCRYPMTQRRPGERVPDFHR